jgi:tryptophan synthase alpha chain
MNRYEQTFSALKKKQSIAFIPFAVAGDPLLPISENIFKSYIDAGADVLEIGYPFSDPVADGPINQRAAQRAIKAGLTHATFFALMYKIRKMTTIPIGLLLYANTVYHQGYNTFCKKAADAGIDSILVADMPPEESDEFLTSLDKNGLQSVFIISELTPAERMAYIAKHVTGFVYVVSRLGTTGTQQDFSTSVAATIKKIRKHTAKPLCVGFGISTPDHILKVKQAGADGAIVGSKLVKTIEDNLSNPNLMISQLSKQVKAYKKSTLS